LAQVYVDSSRDSMSASDGANVSRIVLFSATAGLLIGLDIGYIASILECACFKRDVAHLEQWQDPNSHIPSYMTGLIVGIFSIGCIATSIPWVSANLMDTRGRKVTIMHGSVLFMIGCVLQATTTSINQMLFGRLLAGGSVGMLATSVPVYQSEIAPAHARGYFTSTYQLMITVGIFIATYLDFLLVDRENGWRFAIWIQLIPAAILLVGMYFAPYSPRWLVLQGRTDEALSTLLTLRSTEEAQSEFEDIRASCAEAKAQGVPTWVEVFSGRIGGLLAVGVSLQLLQQLVGMNCFMYFGPRIFQSINLNANMFQAINSAVNVAATMIGVFLIDLVGRRVLLIYGAIGMALSCLVMGLMGMHYMSDGLIKSDSAVPGAVIVSMVFLFVISFAIGWGPTVWVYCSEIFPLKYRSRCISLTTMSNWIGNYIIAFCTPILLEHIGFTTFLIYGVFCMLGLSVALWIPETRGVPLEHIGELFDEKLGKISAPLAEEAQKVELSYGSVSAIKTLHSVTL